MNKTTKIQNSPGSESDQRCYQVRRRPHLTQYWIDQKTYKRWIFWETYFKYNLCGKRYWHGIGRNWTRRMQHPEGNWLVCVVNRSPRNLSTTWDFVWSIIGFPKNQFWKNLRGNQKISIIRLVCTTFRSGICWIGYPYHAMKVSWMQYQAHASTDFLQTSHSLGHIVTLYQ
jgi:hypothetical protein